MKIMLWIIAGLLAAAFAGAGLMKLTQPKEKLAASGMGWTEQFSPAAIKAIGALEVAAAIGLILLAVVAAGTLALSAVLARRSPGNSRTGSPSSPTPASA